MLQTNSYGYGAVMGYGVVNPQGKVGRFEAAERETRREDHGAV